MYVLTFEIKISIGESWDPINQFDPARTWISIDICRGLLFNYVQWVKTRGDCTFCWYW